MRIVYNRVVRAMEEGEYGKVIKEGPEPAPPEKDDVKVKVIKPFKPLPRITRVMRQGKCYYHPSKPASYICASCGKSICSFCATNYGDVYFCPQCAPYQTYQEYAAPPPQKEEVRERGWYNAILAIGIILALIGAIMALVYWPLTSMSAAEFENLQEDYWLDGGHNLKDYRPGDIIVIRDTISRIETDYDPTYGVITILWFKSTGKGDTDFSMSFDADLERDYHVKDTISITLHVDEEARSHDEVIRELNNNLPDISNIDHTISVDLVFYSLVVFGAFLVLIYMLLSKKLQRKRSAMVTGPEALEEKKVEGEGLLHD